MTKEALGWIGKRGGRVVAAEDGIGMGVALHGFLEEVDWVGRESVWRVF